MNLHKYADLTWEDVQKIDSEKTVLLLPAGAIEQHGLHMPLNTDTITSERFCEELVKIHKVFKLLIAPSLNYTYAKPSTVFPGTLSVRGDVFIHYCTDIFRAFLQQGIRKIAVINSHYENTDFLLESADQALGNDKAGKIVVINWWEPVGEKVFVEILGDLWEGAKVYHV